MSGRKTLPPRVSNMIARRQPHVHILMFVGSSLHCMMNHESTMHSLYVG